MVDKYSRQIWSTKTKKANQLLTNELGQGCIDKTPHRSNVESAKCFSIKRRETLEKCAVKTFQRSEKEFETKNSIFYFRFSTQPKIYFDQSQSLKDLGRKFGLIRQQILRKMRQKLCVTFTPRKLLQKQVLGPVLKSFLCPLFTNVRNKLEC
jgi:hypothetical protein